MLGTGAGENAGVGLQRVARDGAESPFLQHLQLDPNQAGQAWEDVREEGWEEFSGA